MRQSLSEVVIAKRRPECSEGDNPGQHVNMCKGPEAQGGLGSSKEGSVTGEV